MTATISLASHGFHLTLTTEKGGTSVVTIPETLAGLRVLRRILRKRELGERSFGGEGHPTSALVEEWLRIERETKLPPPIYNLDIELDL